MLKNQQVYIDFASLRARSQAEEVSKNRPKNKIEITRASVIGLEWILGPWTCPAEGIFEAKMGSKRRESK